MINANEWEQDIIDKLREVKRLCEKGGFCKAEQILGKIKDGSLSDVSEVAFHAEKAEGTGCANINPEAVPDMLKALKQLVSEISYIVEDGTLPPKALQHPSVIAAREAIAKAEGKG